MHSFGQHIVSILIKVGRILGLVDSVVNDVNKDLDFPPVFLLSNHQYWPGFPVGCNNMRTVSLFPLACHKPSFYLIGLSQIMCMARTNSSSQENAML